METASPILNLNTRWRLKAHFIPITLSHYALLGPKTSLDMVVKQKSLLLLQTCASCNIIDSQSLNVVQMKINKGTWRSPNRIFNDLHFKAYHPRLIQSLYEVNSDRRNKIWPNMLSESGNHPNFITNIICTDKATLKLNENVNTQCSLSDRNPHVMIETEFNAPGIWVCRGVYWIGIINPLIFNSTVTEEIYLNMLGNTIWQELSILRDDFESHVFQQGSTLPHFYGYVTDWMNTFQTDGLAKALLTSQHSKITRLDAHDVIFFWGGGCRRWECMLESLDCSTTETCLTE
jgi:hypothetical protein